MKKQFRHWNERTNQPDINVNYYDTKEEAIKGALDYWFYLTPSERKKTFQDYISEVDIDNDDEWISDVMCIVSNGELQDGYDCDTRDGTAREE